MGQVLQDRERLGHLDLEASEMAIRTAMHQMGGVLLEKLLNSDGGGYRGAHLDCSQGHAAEFEPCSVNYVQTEAAHVPMRSSCIQVRSTICSRGFIDFSKRDRADRKRRFRPTTDELPQSF